MALAVSGKVTGFAEEFSGLQQDPGAIVEGAAGRGMLVTPLGRVRSPRLSKAGPIRKRPVPFRHFSAAAAPVGALLKGLIKAPAGSRVVSVASGGNVNLEQLRGLKWN